VVAADGEVIQGPATVLSDEITVRVTANPGESFMDRMIELIEGAKRQRTPGDVLAIGLPGLFRSCPGWLFGF
jgi:K+-transporting ATPase ATPase B chain